MTEPGKCPASDGVEQAINDLLRLAREYQKRHPAKPGLALVPDSRGDTVPGFPPP